MGGTLGVYKHPHQRNQGYDFLKWENST